MGDTSEPTRRWFHFTPGHVPLALLAVEGLLLLSERCGWFGFNQHKGWTVLIAVASVGAAMLLMLLWFIIALIFRWRFQFTIRSLLVLTVAVAIPCSWMATEMKAAKRQKEVVEEIENVGVSVRYDWEVGADRILQPNAQPPEPAWLRNLLGAGFFDNVVEASVDDDAGLAHLKGLTQLQVLDLNFTRVSDAGLVHLKGLTQLQWLNVSLTAVSDAGLAHLKGLTQLQRLELRNTTVSDAGLAHLKGLTQLQSMDLTGTKVSEAGLAHLKGLTQLQWLELRNTTVSDAGLAHLKGLTQLQWLDLDDTTVSDAGLAHLKGLTQLRELDLSRTKVSEEGAKKLRQALPNCSIHY